MANQSLVIGVNSFIGAHLVNTLLNEGHKVTGVYNNNTDRLRNDVVNISIKELEYFDERFDNIYILSAFVNVGLLDCIERKKMFDANIGLVDFVCSKFTDSRIIFCSSVMVYNPSNVLINEFSESGGLNEYGISKIWAERIVEHCMSYAIVRLSFVYGSGMRLTPMIPSYIRQALSAGTIKVWGNGERRQDYIHVSDAVKFLITAANYNGNGKFLATSNNSISNFEIAQIIAKLTSSIIQFEGVDSTPSFYFNNNYTSSILSYKVKMSLCDGIKETIQWIKEMS